MRLSYDFRLVRWTESAQLGPTRSLDEVVTQTSNPPKCQAYVVRYVHVHANASDGFCARSHTDTHSHSHKQINTSCVVKHASCGVLSNFCKPTFLEMSTGYCANSDQFHKDFEARDPGTAATGSNSRDGCNPGPQEPNERIFVGSSFWHDRRARCSMGEPTI